MTDNTPLNADEELRKEVWASLASQMTHAINCTNAEHEKQDSCVDFTEKNFEQLMQLITADRKRVALEARMDEVGKLKLPKMRFDEYGYSPNENAVGFNSAVQLAHNNKLYRIAELKQELEKL